MKFPNLGWTAAKTTAATPIFNLIIGLIIGVAICLIGNTPLQADRASHQQVPRYDPTDSKYQEGLLWRVLRDDQLRGYVYGTMHSGDPRIMAIAPLLEPYLKDVDAICPELEMTLDDTMKLTQEMVYSDATTLIDVVGNELFEEIASKLQAIGIPRIFAIRLKPWAIAMTLSMPPAESPEVLDLTLIKKARELSKQVLPLETVDEQIGVFEGTPVEDQIVLIKDALDQFGDIKSYFEQMIDGYLAQDLLIGDTLMDQQVSHDEMAIDRAMRRLVDDRNKKMAERSSNILSDTSCFVAVGMMHLPGSAGVLSLLEEEGWTIEQVTEFEPISE